VVNTYWVIAFDTIFHSASLFDKFRHIVMMSASDDNGVPLSALVPTQLEGHSHSEQMCYQIRALHAACKGRLSPLSVIDKTLTPIFEHLVLDPVDFDTKQHWWVINKKTLVAEVLPQNKRVVPRSSRNKRKEKVSGGLVPLNPTDDSNPQRKKFKTSRDSLSK